MARTTQWGGCRKPLGAVRLPGFRELGRAALGAALLVSLPMCARPGRPPGGPRDLLPPQVVETFPAAQDQLEELGATVVITFNERISERPTSGTFQQAVVVSPEVPDLEVSHRSDGITLKVPGGWRAQRVYRVRVLPVIQDLFHNRMVGPFEFVFGTGMGFSESVIAGVVSDRITGLPVKGVRVTAVQVGAGGGDLPLFVSPTDSLGIYAMRWMVQGDYALIAFTDVNRNREADPFEQIGDGRAALGRRDTTIVNLTILRPDTTPAVVGRVEVADSVTFRVMLDDFVAQEDSLSGVTVVISSDSAVAPMVRGIVHDGVYRDSLLVRQEVARVTAAAAAAAAADTVGGDGGDGEAPGGAADLEPLGPGTPRDEDQVPEVPPPLLPKQEFYVLLSDTLHFDVEYVVRITGITNINGVGLGAGTDTVVRAAPPPLDAAAADSTKQLLSDTIPLLLEVGQPPPDTVKAAPDTTQTLPDTVQAPPDTTQAPPDTGRVGRP